MTKTWGERGSFIPYPRPVVVPGVGLDDAPLRSICINEVWLAHVLGVAKTLTRPETWVGTQQEVDDACQEAHGIAALITECGGTGLSPNWTLVWSSVQAGPVGAKWQMNEVPGLTGNTLEYEGVFPGTGLPEAQSANILVQGRSISGNLQVGGQFREFYAHSASGAAYAYVAFTVNCLGQPATLTGFTPLILVGQYRQIQVVFGNSPVFVRAIIQDNWTCGPA